MTLPEAPRTDAAVDGGVRAAWIEEWGGPLRQGRRPAAEPGPDEVLVDVEACGVGLTVLNCMRGDLGADAQDLPRVPGHELVGRVVSVGPGVGHDLIGRRVMAYFYLFCGTCRRCLGAREPMCERLAGYVGVHRDGGYAERAVLPARNVLALPESIGAVEATCIPDAIATPVHVAERSAIGPADRVAVIAAGGGVGVHMVQVARVYGAEVVGLDVDARKLGFLQEDLGVDALDSSDFARTALPASWRAGADVVVDLLGRPASLRWALDALAPGGRLVVLTTFRDTRMTVDPRDLVLGEGSVLGSRYASRRELTLAAGMVAEGRVRPVIGARTALDGLEDLHEALATGLVLGRGALTWPA